MPLPLFLGLAAAAGASVIKNQVEKSKATNAAIEDAETVCRKEALAHKPSRTKTELQANMFKLLFKHSFTEGDKKECPPLDSDWKHIPKDTQLKAARKYSLLSWGEYSFYTFEAMYFHYKKKAVHDMLYYDCINSYNPTTGMVDYGSEHIKKDISSWESFEKKFVETVARIWKMESEKDTSVLEFCFNQCHDFEMDLKFFRTNQIKSTFHKHCKGHHGVLQENIDHIRITTMSDGKIAVQFSYYFPRVENVVYSENDTEDDIRRKEWEQKKREREAEEREEKAYRAHEKLLELHEDIATVFQQSLLALYGVLFEKENITFMEEPDYTYEGPSMVDRLNDLESKAGSVMAYAQDYVSKHSK